VPRLSLTPDSGLNIRSPAGSQSPVFRYDDVLVFLGDQAPGVVKIDVEGGEFEVLQSMREMLTSRRPLILVEILPMASLDQTVAKNAQLEGFFRDAAYQILRIAKQNERFIGFQPLDALGPNADPDGWDYLGIPTELLPRIAA